MPREVHVDAVKGIPIKCQRLPPTADAVWRELASKLHRNSAYRCRRAALASSLDTSGVADKHPVPAQSCRTGTPLYKDTGLPLAVSLYRNRVPIAFQVSLTHRILPDGSFAVRTHIHSLSRSMTYGYHEPWGNLSTNFQDWQAPACPVSPPPPGCA